MSAPDSLPHTDALPDGIASALAQAAGRLGPFAPHVHWFTELPSTNDLAAASAERGAREGLVVIADAQTAGRGRQGRVWASPPGAGLYVSVVLRPDECAMPLLTLAAGVAIADGIGAATGLATVLKWPNDVYAGKPSSRRKLAGILAEAGSSSGTRHVVLGFGINVRPGNFSPEIADRATCLEAELGRPVERSAVLVECLASLAKRYDDLQHDRGGAVLVAWRDYAKPLLGHPVEWDEGGRAMAGIALDVDRTGALVVRTSGGMTRVVAGDVRWT